MDSPTMSGYSLKMPMVYSGQVAYLSLFSNISLNGFSRGCVDLSCSLIRLIVSPFPMVLALGPKFRIPTQIFKCQSDLCEVVSVLCERQVAI